MKCNMDLNITSGDETLSITVLYRMNTYGTGTGLKNAIIGNDNPGWDHIICMNDSKSFIVSNAKKNPHHIMVVIIVVKKRENQDTFLGIRE